MKGVSMKYRIALFIVASLAASVFAQERITLGTPETAPANTRYRVDQLVLKEDDPDTPDNETAIRVQLVGVERPSLTASCVYSSNTTPTGATLLTGLNKANLSTAYAGNSTTGSLKQRIFHRLVVMGEANAVCGRSLAGSLTGTSQ